MQSKTNKIQIALYDSSIARLPYIQRFKVTVEMTKLFLKKITPEILWKNEKK